MGKQLRMYRGKREAQAGERLGAPGESLTSLAGGGELRIYLMHCPAAQGSLGTGGQPGKGEPASPARSLPGAATSMGLTGHTPSARAASTLSPALLLPRTSGLP